MADEAVKSGCAKIFREVTGLTNSSTHYDWSDERLLTEPMDALGVDSLSLLEFVMTIENTYDVELREEDVNRCRSVGDLVALIISARNGSN
jgi:acyl carrier protein